MLANVSVYTLENNNNFPVQNEERLIQYNVCLFFLTDSMSQQYNVAAKKLLWLGNNYINSNTASRKNEVTALPTMS